MELEEKPEGEVKGENTLRRARRRENGVGADTYRPDLGIWGELESDL